MPRTCQLKSQDSQSVSRPHSGLVLDPGCKMILQIHTPESKPEVDMKARVLRGGHGGKAGAGGQLGDY